MTKTTLRYCDVVMLRNDAYEIPARRGKRYEVQGFQHGLVAMFALDEASPSAVFVLPETIEKIGGAR